MKITWTFGLAIVLSVHPAIAQTDLQLPKTLRAGEPLSISTRGSGSAVLYVVGLGQVVKRPLQLGNVIVFQSGELHSAGHYVAVLLGPSSRRSAAFDVIPATRPKYISFWARPSRVPVNRMDGISGVAYLFDAFRNLMMDPTQVTFLLSNTPGAGQERTVTAWDGVAWVRMNSAAKAGTAEFSASADGVREKRILQLVPGDPCGLKMKASRSGQRVDVETEPVRDCSGNPVPDGTVITFTESYQGAESTVDAPLKRGIARTQMPAHAGAVLSVASGVVMGNEIRLQGGT
jgi:hypothetical protein